MYLPKLQLLQFWHPWSKVWFPVHEMLVLNWLAKHEPTLHKEQLHSMRMLVAFQVLAMKDPLGQDGHRTHLSLKLVPSHGVSCL